jgi:ribosomal protein S16
MVAINQKARRNAKPIETLAVYDPRVKLGETQKTVQWSVDRIKYWLEKGAQPSESAAKLLTMVRSAFVVFSVGGAADRKCCRVVSLNRVHLFINLKGAGRPLYRHTQPHSAFQLPFSSWWEPSEK